MKTPGRRTLLLLSPFALAAGLKLAHALLVKDTGVDGGYYTDVAKHVRDGEGISTCVSLYHQGFEQFPHASPIYPLWPLLHGLTARVIPLHAAGVGLGTAGWITAVLFAFLWGRRLSPGPLWDRAPWFEAGHALALVLAVNSVFFRYTSVPYTEGLAFALLFAGLWWFHPRWKDLDVAGGFAMGVWLGALLLVRSQLVIVAMAAALTHAGAIVLLPERGRRIEAACACASAFLATLTPQLLRIGAWSEVPPWVALLRFELARERALLSPMHVLVESAAGTGHLHNFVESLPVAFAPRGPMAYWRVYQGFQYALPVALVVLAFAAVRRIRDRSARDSLRAWARPERLGTVFAFALAAAGFLSLHFIRKDFTTEWHFGRRHSLTALFAFFLAWLFLARHASRAVRGTAALILAVTLACSHALAFKIVAHEWRGSSDARTYDALVRGLQEERNERKNFVVALHGMHVQKVAWQTDGIGFHWIYRRTSAEDAAALARLGVRWILLEPDETRGWPLRSAIEAPGSPWRRVPDLDGFAVYELDDTIGRAAGGST